MIKISKVVKQTKIPFVPYQIIVDVDTAMIENDLRKLFKSQSQGFAIPDADLFGREILRKITELLSEG